LGRAIVTRERSDNAVVAAKGQMQGAAAEVPGALVIAASGRGSRTFCSWQAHAVAETYVHKSSS